MKVDKYVVHYKTRFMSKKYTHTEKIDYIKVFSLVAKHSSITSLLVLKPQFDIELVQMDVDIMFLHDNLENEIYITQSK